MSKLPQVAAKRDFGPKGFKLAHPQAHRGTLTNGGCLENPRALVLWNGFDCNSY